MQDLRLHKFKPLNYKLKQVLIVLAIYKGTNAEFSLNYIHTVEDIAKKCSALQETFSQFSVVNTVRLNILRQDHEWL